MNVIPPATDRTHLVTKKRTREPNIIEIIMQSLYIGTYSLVKSSLQGADIIIEPSLAHFGFADFLRAGERILQGELAAEHSLPEIKRKLEL